MAMALLRLLPFLGRILRAVSFFEDINKVRKIEKAVLTYKDVKSLVKHTKKVKDYVLDELFKMQLKSNNFIFLSEDDLINFVKGRDSDAKIMKLLELKEVDLYIVEGKVFSNKWTGLLNYFVFALLINQFNLFNQNVINAINNTYNDLLNELNNMENRILQELANQKANDIANTYCIQCSCCCSCSCDKGSCSCCCTCQCSLVHYTQSWDNLKSYIQSQFNDYRDYLNKKMVNESENSLLVQFTALFELLMQFFFTNVKEKYLFAVIKEKEIIKEMEKDKRKTGVMRTIYKFLDSIRYQKVEYRELIKQLRDYLYFELKKDYTEKQVQVLFNTAIKQYHFKKVKFKKGNKTYIYII